MESFPICLPIVFSYFTYEPELNSADHRSEKKQFTLFWCMTIFMALGLGWVGQVEKYLTLNMGLQSKVGSAVAPIVISY